MDRPIAYDYIKIYNNRRSSETTKYVIGIYEAIKEKSGK